MIFLLKLTDFFFPPIMTPPFNLNNMMLSESLKSPQLLFRSLLLMALSFTACNADQGSGRRVEWSSTSTCVAECAKLADETRGSFRVLVCVAAYDPDGKPIKPDDFDKPFPSGVGFCEPPFVYDTADVYDHDDVSASGSDAFIKPTRETVCALLDADGFIRFPAQKGDTCFSVCSDEGLLCDHAVANGAPAESTFPLHRGDTAVCNLPKGVVCY